MSFEPRSYEVGASVRVTRGTLSGVTGVVIQTTSHPPRSVVSIDFWASGVLVVLDSDALELIHQNEPLALT